MQTEARTAEPYEKIQGAPSVTLSLEPEPVRAPATISPTAAPLESTRLDVGRSPLDQLQALLARGITLDQVREYLDLQREWEAEEARRAYHRAMAAFKREELPEIIKDQHVNYPLKEGGTVEYFHEELAQVVAAIVPAMAKHGLSHRWEPLQEKGPGGSIKVTCVITHADGFSMSTWLEAMPDTSGRKNAIQSVKSTISYLERILLLAATGTAAKGMDDDGRGAQGDLEPQDERPRGKPATSAPQSTSGEPARPAGERDDRHASEKQRLLVESRVKEKGLDVYDLLQHLAVPSLDDLRRHHVDEALAWIGRARR